ncbi:hypothetical protein [Rhodococcus pseudokoreensis]|uniref:hypothetical protein n=1 Tax=Rhodococcus pseudokoreensis TaxID=2811421 RepID=UPI001981FE17|nr:hypothetical protein [Rhodococcus pseudokoreensis]
MPTDFGYRERGLRRRNGATHCDVAGWFDATIWVSTNPVVAYRRCVERGIDPPAFIEEWMAQENPFLNDDRPWARASVIISGERVPAGTSNGCSMRDRQIRM